MGALNPKTLNPKPRSFFFDGGVKVGRQICQAMFIALDVSELARDPVLESHRPPQNPKFLEALNAQTPKPLKPRTKKNYYRGLNNYQHYFVCSSFYISILALNLILIIKAPIS